MSQNQIVQARISGEIKAQASEALAAMGLSLSDAIRIMLTSVAREKALPAEFFRPNETTLAAIKEAAEGNLPTFHSAEELFMELNSDD